ncbi:MAG: hypothetical protein ACTTJI_05590 [Capnocytophaga sp.]|uniref:hypothetical protein n=1 Tax=Capnocytophaga sp. TaxID=44737 RepID=UPI003FA18AE7
MANLQNNPTKEKKSTENIVVLPRRQSEDKVKTKRRRNAFFSLYQLSAQQLQNRKNNYFPRLTPLHSSHYLPVRLALLKQVQAV